MLRSWPWILAFLGFMGGLALVGIWLLRAPGQLPQSTPGLRDAFSAAETAMFRPGDLILRRGSSTASELIVLFLDDGLSVSHCGMLLADPGNPPGAWQVLHCINGSFGGQDGVQVQPLAGFNANSMPASLVVLRPKVGDSQLQRILLVARHLSAAKIPFDNNFDLTDRRSLYCTEMLVEIFEQSGWWPPAKAGISPFYRIKGIMLDFATFLDPRYFQVILSHNPRVGLR